MSNQRFELDYYGTKYNDCFFYLSKYINGNIQISVFGINPKTKQSEHFIDISLDQNSIDLEDDEIVVDNYLKGELINQLQTLGILREKVGTCVIQCIEYPIYKINFDILNEYTYETQDISA